MFDKFRSDQASCDADPDTNSGRACLIVLVGALLLAAVGVAAASDPAELHGAAPVDVQLQRLQTLQPRVDVTAPPRWVDPVIWASSIPADNPLTEARVALGRKLYFETRLSVDNTVSCATCHDVTRGFTDQRPLSEGVRGQIGRRNAPTTLNAALLFSQFWDGRVATLEEQALLPIVNPIEMGLADGAAAVARIAGDRQYREDFQRAYGRAINYQDIGRAIAAFERTLIFLDAPFDRFLRGDASAVSDSVKRGWVLFNGKARCVTCHPMNLANPLGTDNRFHNIGVAARHRNFDELALQALGLLDHDGSLLRIDELALTTDLSELGRFMITRNPADVGAFRTEQLRNIGITGPYMHDGSMQTLWDVMDHYNKGGEPNQALDGGIEALALSEPEIDDLVALMFALTDVRFADMNQQRFEQQKAHAAKHRPFRDERAAQRQLLHGDPGMRSRP